MVLGVVVSIRQGQGEGKLRCFLLYPGLILDFPVTEDPELSPQSKPSGSLNVVGIEPSRVVVVVVVRVWDLIDQLVIGLLGERE